MPKCELLNTPNCFYDQARNNIAECRQISEKLRAKLSDLSLTNEEKNDLEKRASDYDRRADYLQSQINERGCEACWARNHKTDPR